MVLVWDWSGTGLRVSEGQIGRDWYVDAPSTAMCTVTVPPTPENILSPDPTPDPTPDSRRLQKCIHEVASKYSREDCVSDQRKLRIIFKLQTFSTLP